MNGQPGNWRSSITSAATTVLGAAIALYVAVHLIEAVAPALIAMAVVVAVVGAGLMIFRHRRSHW
ncbi:MAG: hypothetical protein ACRDYB_04620 [Acidimicrobiales bacterium]